jgi:hypothetical protein
VSDSVDWLAAAAAAEAASEGVALEAGRAGAHRPVVGHLALGVGRAGGGRPEARVLALVVEAGEVGGTLVVVEAFASDAGLQGVTRVSSPGEGSRDGRSSSSRFRRASHGQVHTGRGVPDRSEPTLHSASWAQDELIGVMQPGGMTWPQGLGWHRLPEETAWLPELTFLVPLMLGLPAALRQVPPLSALGSPSVPGGQEHSARCCTARQSAVGLQQGAPPQKVGPHGSACVVGEERPGAPMQVES